MTILHLTETKNLRSIYKNGLRPSKISLPHHWKRFKRDGLKEDKCIYTWDAETYENGRFIKDMIYCRMFIHPRNAAYDDNPDNWETGNWVDFRKYGKKLYNFSASYTLLEIDLQDYDNALPWTYMHAQEPTDDKFCTLVNMDYKYAHDDKPMIILRGMVGNARPVEEIQVRRYKNEDLGFTFRKTRRL